MRTSVLSGMREFPLAWRVLTAGGAAVASGVIAAVLLAGALGYWFDGARVVANVLLGAAIVTVAASGAVWFRMLPSARWLGVPVTLGLLALCWDLLVAVLPA